jgi:hypothetical protein
MANTLGAMHNIKGKQVEFTQAFPQAKLKEDILMIFIEQYLIPKKYRGDYNHV